tara:strand:- start:143 stop:1174 length:1032 start_codon:yes stop_codon:yes gene_type:complete
MIKVSIIIPVYNVAEYLNECINSLIHQTLKEIEFIFINDGSTDTCREIIESYQQKDSRILLINQENKGVSAARNAGISVAKGRYIGFVDGDDYVETTMFETMYKLGFENDLDIVISNFITEQNGLKINKRVNFSTNQVFCSKDIQKEIIPYFLREDGLNSCWNKLYKSDLIKGNSISFPIGVANGEDALFNLNCFNKATKVQFFNYRGYYYREVKGSATRDILTKDYFKIALDVFNFNHVLKCNLSLSKTEATKLKSIRLITKVVSLIHLYFKSNSEKAFKLRFLYVKNMVSNKQVQDEIHKNWGALKANKSKYHQLFLYFIKIKWTLGLVLLTTYSNFRNKS